MRVLSLALATLLAACSAAPAAAQIVTHPTELPDTNRPPDGVIVINRAETTPRVARGERLIPCGRRGELWEYRVERGPVPCPSASIVVEHPVALPVVDGKVVLNDCGSRLAPFRYATGACPLAPAPAPTPAPTPTPEPVPAPAPTPDPLPGKLTEIRTTKNGAIPLAPVIENYRVVGAYRVVETASTSKANGITIRNVEGLDLIRGGIRLRGDLGPVLVENVTLRHAAKANTGTDLPACFEIDAPNVTLRNVVCDGFLSEPVAGKYLNGDGPTGENKALGLRLENVRSTNSSDGCLDIKQYFTATNLYLAWCKRPLRSWGGGLIDHLELGDTINRGGIGAAAGIWQKGGNDRMRVLHIRKLTVRFTRPDQTIIAVEDGPATVRIDECDIEAPAGTKFANAGDRNMKWELGATCSRF